MLRAQNLNLEDINRKRGFEQKIFKDILGGRKALQNKQYQSAEVGALAVLDI